MTNHYPRESVEFQPITVELDGVAVTTGVTVSVVSRATRPTVWVAPTTLDGKIGVMVGSYTIGSWRVWAKVVDSPETPVIDCGYFTID